ncbi:hypothetical protein A2U01_0049331, partial [Trifolium medium]|nr:hypothetical protein [Trifolium medium]
MESLLAEKIICMGGGSTDGDQGDEGQCKCNAYKKLWKCSAPTKFVIRGWRVLLNRIAMKEH